MVMTIFIGLFTTLSLLLLSPVQAAPSVDLHAHLFMDKGLSPVFQGHFNGPLKAISWKNRLSSMANPETLEASDLGVVVVSLYAYPLLNLSLRDSIRRQVRDAEAFVATHPQWVIARSASEGKQAQAQGKRVLVLAIEGASGILENEDDLKEFIDEKGIRIVTLLHLIDDDFGGVAFLKGYRSIYTPWAWITQIFNPLKEDGVMINRNGLKESGEIMVQKLIDRKVWIDLAHSSDQAQRKIIPMLEKAGQPLLYSHTVLRHHFKAERGIADWQLDAVQKSGGIIGLMPSAEMLVGTEVDLKICPSMCISEKLKICTGGSIYAFATHYVQVATKIGAGATVLGSDFNGGISHLEPPSCPTGTDFDKVGLWNISQTGLLWNALKKLGAPVAQPPQDQVTTFLNAWAKVGAKI